MVVTLYALRSQKTGRYFKYEQYADDGWGEYHDTVSWPFSEYDMPDFFSEYAVSDANRPNGSPWCVLKDHTPDDVDVVEFRLMMQPQDG